MKTPDVSTPLRLNGGGDISCESQENVVSIEQQSYCVLTNDLADSSHSTSNSQDDEEVGCQVEFLFENIPSIISCPLKDAGKGVGDENSDTYDEPDGFSDTSELRSLSEESPPCNKNETSLKSITTLDLTPTVLKAIGGGPTSKF